MFEQTLLSISHELWLEISSYIHIDSIIWFFFLLKSKSELTLSLMVSTITTWNQSSIKLLITSEIKFLCYVLIKIYLFNIEIKLKERLFLTISSYTLTDHFWCVKVFYLNVYRYIYLVPLFFCNKQMEYIQNDNKCRHFSFTYTFDNCQENPMHRIRF